MNLRAGLLAIALAMVSFGAMAYGGHGHQFSVPTPNITMPNVFHYQPKHQTEGQDMYASANHYSNAGQSVSVAQRYTRPNTYILLSTSDLFGTFNGYRFYGVAATGAPAFHSLGEDCRSRRAFALGACVEVYVPLVYNLKRPVPPVVPAAVPPPPVVVKPENG